MASAIHFKKLTGCGMERLASPEKSSERDSGR